MNFQKNNVFSNFFENFIKKCEKMKKNKKQFPRPSGSLSARRTHCRGPHPPQEGLISSREPAAGLR